MTVLHRGDIFQRKGHPGLWCVVALTASTSVYAQAFDLERGTMGQPQRVDADDVRPAGWNAFRPAPRDDAWEYARIDWRVLSDDSRGWTGSEWYEAVAEGDEGATIIARTPMAFFIRGEPELLPSNLANRARHEALVRELRAQGWELVPERRLRWYAVTLRRRRIRDG